MSLEAAVIGVFILERGRLHRPGGDIDNGWADGLDQIGKTVGWPDDRSISSLWNGGDGGAGVEYRADRCGAGNGRDRNSGAKTP